MNTIVLYEYPKALSDITRWAENMPILESRGELPRITYVLANEEVHCIPFNQLNLEDRGLFDLVQSREKLVIVGAIPSSGPSLDFLKKIL